MPDHDPPSKSSKKTPSGDPATTDFHGTPLPAAEAAALRDLEALSGNPLKAYFDKKSFEERKKIRWHPWGQSPCPWNGYLIQNMHIIAVALSTCLNNLHAWVDEFNLVHGTSSFNPAPQFKIQTGPCLENLPPSFGDLEYLETLNLSVNNLKALPPVVGKLSRLKVLQVSWNYLQALPVEIGNLISLERLEIDYNRLEDLPLEIGSLSALKFLSVRGNRLKEIPVSISSLHNLEDLCLEQNILNALPVTIGDLQALKGLELQSNRLRSLPDGIGQLRNLHRLGVEMNLLEVLPNSIGNLMNLGNLFLGGNPHLRTYPASITRLRSLKFLKLEPSAIPKADTPSGTSLYSWLRDLEDSGCNIVNSPLGEPDEEPWEKEAHDILFE